MLVQHGLVIGAVRESDVRGDEAGELWQDAVREGPYGVVALRIQRAVEGRPGLRGTRTGITDGATATGTDSVAVCDRADSAAGPDAADGAVVDAHDAAKEAYVAVLFFAVDSTLVIAVLDGRRGRSPADIAAGSGDASCVSHIPRGNDHRLVGTLPDRSPVQPHDAADVAVRVFAGLGVEVDVTALHSYVHHRSLGADAAEESGDVTGLTAGDVHPQVAEPMALTVEGAAKGITHGADGRPVRGAVPCHSAQVDVCCQSHSSAGMAVAGIHLGRQRAELRGRGNHHVVCHSHERQQAYQSQKYSFHFLWIKR